jgi:hypothetical protein
LRIIVRQAYSLTSPRLRRGGDAPYARGLKLHIENVIRSGTLRLETMEIAPVLGVRAATSAVPIMLEEIEAAGVALPDDKS